MRHLNLALHEGAVVDYDMWLDMYSEWLKYMQHLGPYIARGFKDVEDKMNCIKSNRILLCDKLKFFKKTDPEYTSLLDFVQFERSLGIQHFNTCNLSDEFPKAVEMTKHYNVGKLTKE